MTFQRLIMYAKNAAKTSSHDLEKADMTMTDPEQGSEDSPMQP